MPISCNEEILESGGPGAFYLGKAEALLPELLSRYRGQISLIYLDPPFGTGDTFRMKLLQKGRPVTVPVYDDARSGEEYVEWMRTILTGCHELLNPSGSLYLHIDFRMSARMRILLDEIFGERNFMNEIVWCYRSGGRSKRYFPRKHDTILFYRKSAKSYFSIEAVGIQRGPERRNHMKRVLDSSGKVGYSIRSGSKTYVYYEDSLIYPSDVWTDIEHLQQKDSERSGYATQKPESLLKRIILSSSRPGDLVCDLFSGSGTTASVALQTGRRFLAADSSPFALYLLRERLLQKASNLSLFHSEGSLEIHFPEPEEPVHAEYSMVIRGGAPGVEIRRAYFDVKHPIVYAAVGRMEGTCFFPVRSIIRPEFPLILPTGFLDEPVLELTDALGRQCFVSISGETGA